MRNRLRVGKWQGDRTEMLFVFEESPSCEWVGSTLLGPYLSAFCSHSQHDENNWMVSLHLNGLNGILGDKMVCFSLVTRFPC